MHFVFNNKTDIGQIKTNKKNAAKTLVPISAWSIGAPLLFSRDNSHPNVF